MHAGNAIYGAASTALTVTPRTMSLLPTPLDPQSPHALRMQAPALPLFPDALHDSFAFHPTPPNPTGAPTLPTDPSIPGGELLLLGPAAALAPPSTLARLVARCTASSPTTASTASAASTASTTTTAPGPSPAERAAIRAARAFDPLPEGWCYDGTYYFDAFGDRSEEHPDMDRWVVRGRSTPAWTGCGWWCVRLAVGTTGCGGDGGE